MILVALATFTALSLPQGIYDDFGQGRAMAKARAAQDANVAHDAAAKARERVVTFRVEDLQRCADGARYLTTYEPPLLFIEPNRAEQHLERLTSLPLAMPCAPGTAKP
jgi:hypothetical protein